ncbi:minor extracellular serine protease Vpr [Lentibacillus halodurans]|uniref:Minor extracellular serine protease Vpr n=1 Tax=Lentibacillus halodurans TaxID=237679 RepID=A0A1I0ZQ19_9BACI|nr:S8 family serine peptidase [Lentibacillus halodurans]SFB26458.1 minor extracellular serine protease Vpr [Lentibacillus halodurans]
MRRLLITLTAIIPFLPLPVSALSQSGQAETEESVIIEVDGNPAEHKSYLSTYHPYIDVVATYDTLFNGLALKADPKRFENIESLDFIKAVHPVTSYETQSEPLIQTENSVIPSALNDTSYTGKGVQVAVIDTGMDYEHPDLVKNYAGGYDVVDLDDDPMETIASEGMPTLHGTHVAGIIAADGELKGVAPDAAIRAYRALGPGGMGTSVQVIAALEQAVDDGADIINLSLGNTINGPDFPTSAAVNRAAALGVPVVIANGNNGPGNWTIGSPATAANALSVGAVSNPQTVPYLYETMHHKNIPLTEMEGSTPWKLDKSYDVEVFDGQNVQGKIALMERGETPFSDMVKQAQDSGAVAAIIYNHEQGSFQGMISDRDDSIQIPAASISRKNGEWLIQNAQNNHLYVKTKYETTEQTIADFSSRGPVTVNWNLKPDVSAPGTNVLSTVPNGYQELQGTSMAAPQVTGAMALLMEAHPEWTIQELMGAIKTTAKRVKNDHDEPFDPVIQGTGEIQPQKAINTPTVIDHPLLSFGKITEYRKTKSLDLTIENKSDKQQTYTFSTPKKQKGMSWDLPLSFTLDEGETKKLPIKLTINSSQIDEGIHQGWLTLNQDNDEQYQLPYLFVNQSADYPKAMGFDFTLKPFSDDTYAYQLYLTDPAESIDVMLYDPDTLMYEQTLLQSSDVDVGLNEGQMDQSELPKPGQYLAVINVKLKNGQMESYQTELHIPE